VGKAGVAVIAAAIRRRRAALGGARLARLFNDAFK
jgi:hypothetical protein